MFKERFDQLFGQIGNLPEVVRGGRRQQFGGGIAFAEGEDPSAGDVLDEQSEFGKRQRQQKVELIDQTRALTHDRLQATGDLAKRAQLGGQHLDGCGPFVESIACGGAGFDRIGLLAAEEGGAVVLVALRIAAGDGEGGVDNSTLEGVQEVQQVVGILVGNVETHGEVDGAELGNDLLETGAQLGITGGGFDELQLAGGRLQIVAQESGVVAVARGVDADADADHVGIGLWLRSGSVVKQHKSLQKGW